MFAKRNSLALATLLGCVASSSMAHTVWLEPVDAQAGDYSVKFGGHAGKLESYKPEKLKSVDATDAQGKKLTVMRRVTPEGVLLHVDGSPAMIAMHFDNGIFSRLETGPSIEKPMNEVPGAKRATYAVKYHKTIFDWSPRVTKAIGQPFEVVPLDATQPKSGEPMRVQVLKDGKPVVGVKLGRGEEGTAKDPVTDANGVASFVPRSGVNRLWAGERIALADNAKFTELSYEYLLGFIAK